MKPSAKRLPSQRKLLKVAAEFCNLREDAVLCGGIAMSLYGSARLTGDVDVVARAVPYKHLPGKPLSFGGIRVKSAGVSVDIIVRDDDWKPLYDAAWANALTIDLPEGRIKIVEPEYLIAMKIAAGRPKDQDDVREILTNGTAVNAALLKTIVRKYLGLYAATTELEQIIAEAEWMKKRGKIGNAKHSEEE